MKRTLVIAKYKEDISWTKSIDPSINVVVIDKDGKVPNYGRESHSYFYYIYEHYEELDGDYIFCQGDPLAHCKDFIHLVNNSKTLPYSNFGDKLMTCDLQGFAQHNPPLSISQVWNIIFPEIAMPEQFPFYCGAQFLVNSSVIKTRSKDFYHKCLQCHLFFTESPWIFERLWNYIFNIPTIPMNIIYYPVGLGVGDSIISIANIQTVHDQSKCIGLILFPNQKYFSSQDIESFCRKNINNIVDIVYLSQEDYHYLSKLYHDYALMRRGAWEQLINGLSLVSGISGSLIFPTLPRQDYTTKKVYIQHPSNFYEENRDKFNLKGKYILFNPLSTQSIERYDHHMVTHDCLSLLEKVSRYNIVLVGQDKINTEDHPKIINITGLTPSVFDVMSLADHSYFCMSAANNLAHYCYFNDIPCFVFANRVISHHWSFFKKWMASEKVEILEYSEQFNIFLGRLGQFLSRNKLSLFDI